MIFCSNSLLQVLDFWLCPDRTMPSWPSWVITPYLDLVYQSSIAVISTHSGSYHLVYTQIFFGMTFIACIVKQHTAAFIRLIMISAFILLLLSSNDAIPYAASFALSFYVAFTLSSVLLYIDSTAKAWKRFTVRECFRSEHGSLQFCISAIIQCFFVSHVNPYALPIFCLFIELSSPLIVCQLAFLYGFRTFHHLYICFVVPLLIDNLSLRHASFSHVHLFIEQNFA